MVCVRVGLVHVPVGLWVLMDQGIPLWPKLIIEEGRSIDALAKNRSYHGPINNIDTKAYCRHLKKLTCIGTLQVFIRVHILEQSCWYVRPTFVNCCLSNLLSGSTLPPPPFPV